MVICDHFVAIKEEKMTLLQNNQLIMIKGGLNISGTLLNSIARLMNSIMDAGRSLGSGIRRMVSGRKCPI